MKVSLIVAIDLEGGIGKNNDLMWHLPSDMQFFKETTKNQIFVNLLYMCVLNCTIANGVDRSCFCVLRVLERGIPRSCNEGPPQAQ